MKATFRIVLGLCAAVAIVALLAPTSHAQCTVSREFGGQGNAMFTGRIIVNTTTNNFPNNGNEHKSFWDAGKAATNNSGGVHFGSVALCTDAWWQTGTAFLGVQSGIQGFIASLNCQMTACVDPMVISTLVEDTTPDGSEAGFVIYTTDETPAGIRYYDHARTAGIAGVPSAQATHTFQRYPRVDVTGSTGPPPTTKVTNNYADLALNYHGADLTAQATSGIVSYDIMMFHGGADPGRLRSAWTLVKQIAYSNAGIAGDMINVSCPTSAGDTYLAVGATFDGDGNKVLSAGDVKSVLVGRATSVECNPNIADPEPKVKRPSIQRTKPLGR